MARVPRAHQIVPGLPHHVYFRGNNRRRLFSFPRCFLRYLRELERASRTHGCAVHALVLMTNHGHLVLTPPSQEALSAMMARVGQQYAVYRNETRGGSGKVFEERYRCKAVTNEAYLARLLPYVELNPERAGIVDEAAEYPWSTYPLHLGRPECSRVPASLWSPSEWWRSLGVDLGARAERYRQMVAACRANASEWTESPDHHTSIAEVESASAPFSRRLRRPDGTRAAEQFAPYGGLGTTRPGSREFSEG